MLAAVMALGVVAWFGLGQSSARSMVKQTVHVAAAYDYPPVMNDAGVTGACADAEGNTYTSCKELLQGMDQGCSELCSADPDCYAFTIEPEGIDLHGNLFEYKEPHFCELHKPTTATCKGASHRVNGAEITAEGAASVLIHENRVHTQCYNKGAAGVISPAVPEKNFCDDFAARQTLESAPLAYKNLFVVTREDRIVFDTESKILFYDANCDGARTINSVGGQWPFTDCDCQNDPQQPNYCFCGQPSGKALNAHCAGPWHPFDFNAAMTETELEKCR
jgi:hypothetical protein